LTEPDLREKDPEPEGNWENAANLKIRLTKRNFKQDRALDVAWEEELAGLPAGLQDVEQAEGLEEAFEMGQEKARAEMPGKTDCPENRNLNNLGNE
jgi:hypothetical protein